MRTDRITLIDTCSLLEEHGGELFLKNELAGLVSSGEKVIVPLAVIHELESIARRGDRELAGRAKKVLRAVVVLREAGFIGIYGDENDGTFADNVFQKVITILGMRYQITVITQENNLAQDILAMGHMSSVRRKKITVRKINSQGKLVDVTWKGDNFSNGN